MGAVSMSEAVAVLASLPPLHGTAFHAVEVVPGLVDVPVDLLMGTVEVRFSCVDTAQGAALACLLGLTTGCVRVRPSYRWTEWVGWHAGYRGGRPVHVRVDVCEPLPTVRATAPIDTRADAPADALALAPAGGGR